MGIEPSDLENAQGFYNINLSDISWQHSGRYFGFWVKFILGFSLASEIILSLRLSLAPGTILGLSLAAGNKIRLASHGNGVYEAALPDIANNVSMLSKKEKINLKVWPNPLSASAGKTLKLDNRVDQWLLMDVQGRILLEGRRLEINFSDYSRGTYLLQLQTEGDNVQTKKIIVQ